eukprot:g45269.t1
MQKEAGGFSFLRLWWDVEKNHIRVFCQEYARKSTKKQKSRIEETLDLELHLSQPMVDVAVGNVAPGFAIEVERSCSAVEHVGFGGLVRCQNLSLTNASSELSSSEVEEVPSGRAARSVFSWNERSGEVELNEMKEDGTAVSAGAGGQKAEVSQA